MAELVVDKVGLLATVQDLGRPGLAHFGVPTAGAVDRLSLRNANRLVGNVDNAAGIEIAVKGLTVTCNGEMRVAVVGARWAVDGAPMSSGITRPIADGATISVDQPGGAYAYLAIAGGIDVPAVL